MPYIEAPFPKIAYDVVQPPGIRLEFSDFVRTLARIPVEPTEIRGFSVRRTPKVFRGRARAARVLPLRFGWQRQMMSTQLCRRNTKGNRILDNRR